jgi:hypothetical protein
MLHKHVCVSTYSINKAAVTAEFVDQKVTCVFINTSYRINIHALVDTV